MLRALGLETALDESVAPFPEPFGRLEALEASVADEYPPATPADFEPRSDRHDMRSAAQQVVAKPDPAAAFDRPTGAATRSAHFDRSTETPPPARPRPDALSGRDAAAVGSRQAHAPPTTHEPISRPNDHETASTPDVSMPIRQGPEPAVLSRSDSDERLADAARQQASATVADRAVRPVPAPEEPATVASERPALPDAAPAPPGALEPVAHAGDPPRRDADRSTDLASQVDSPESLTAGDAAATDRPDVGDDARLAEVSAVAGGRPVVSPPVAVPGGNRPLRIAEEWKARRTLTPAVPPPDAPPAAAAERTLAPESTSDETTAASFRLSVPNAMTDPLGRALRETPDPQTGRTPEEWLARLRATAAAERDLASRGGPERPARSRPVPPHPPESRSGASALETRQPTATLVRRDAVSPAVPQSAVAGARVPSVPSPIGPSARRFLRPLVGIDPGAARLHRGPAADTLVRAADADALTRGADIFVANDQDLRSPEGLGLLAHELTHVARERSPQFVPPIARPSAIRTTGRIAPAPLVPMPASQPGVADRQEARGEEDLALTVESETRALAAAGRERQDALDVSDAGAVAEGADGDSGPTPGAPQAVVAPLGRPRSSKAVWGGLPAPWEPLPDLPETGQSHGLSPATAAAAANGNAASFVGAPTASPSTAAASTGAPSGGASSGNGASAAGAAAAAHDREVPASAAATAPRTAAALTPSPDIDGLARQVYDVLKRRLAAERRRST